MLRRLALFAVLLVAACGGDEGGDSTVPAEPWGSLRRDSSNSGLSSGRLENNQGIVTLLNGEVGGVTLSTPILASNGRIYLGTANGLVALDNTGAEQWRFDRCELSTTDGPCPSDTCVEVGPINSTPTVTANQDIVFGSDGVGNEGGFIFGVHDDGDSFTCGWAVRPSDVSPNFRVRSSPVALIDQIDRSLISAFVGTSDGRLEALNGDGTTKWRFPDGELTLGDLTSSPAFSINVLYLTDPAGVLYAVDLAGRQLWRVALGAIDGDLTLLPSPGAGESVYAFGVENSVFAINRDGTQKWRFPLPVPIAGSLAFATVGLTEPDGIVSFDTGVFVVDELGTLYILRDETGGLLELFRCSLSGEDCIPDTCEPDEGVCIPDELRCSLSDEPCTPQDCPTDQGTCVATDAVFPIGPDPVPVQTSPAISSEAFAVVGSADGRVCARSFQGLVPEDPAWEDGCVAIGDDLPTRSSPAIGSDGVIYITTDSGLYEIR